MVVGMRAVIETIRAGQPMGKIYVYERAQDRALLRQLWGLAKERAIPCSKVPAAYLKRLSTKNHQGAIAFVSPIPFVDLGNLIQNLYEEGKMPLLVLLDRVQDVRNMGAIARTALSMGVDAMVIPTQGSALIGEDAMKTSAGALNHLSLCRVPTLSSAITYLQESGLQVIACDEKAKKPITAAFLSQPTAFLFGNEGVGIEQTHRKMADHAFTIPMQGAIASLNVSAAAAIVLYECARQRRVGPKSS